jgi:GST-like protein
MIELYAHGSPNPHKISIALEELQLPYAVVPTNPFAGETQRPEYLAINPNGKVPFIVDRESGITLFESNAILLYLAEKSGRLFPREGQGRYEGMKWLFFQSSCMGPMYGQRAWFSLFAPEKIGYAIKRYEDERTRLSGVIDAALAKRTWFLDDYSIVDIAVFGWAHCAVAQGFAIDAFPNYQAWYARMWARPAVRRGVEIPGVLPDFSAFIAARRAFTLA